jgi:hypothetical protein
MMGMRVVETPTALDETKERLFPASRHRSARIRKKLIQRHGTEFRMAPCAFEVGGHTLIVHPAIAARFRLELAAKIDTTVERTLFGGHPCP